MRAEDIRAKTLCSMAFGLVALMGSTRWRRDVGMMARRFHFRVGDKLTFIAPRGTTTAFGTMPRMKAYHVAAILMSECRSTIRVSYSCRSSPSFGKRIVSYIEVTAENAEKIDGIQRIYKQTGPTV